MDFLSVLLSKWIHKNIVFINKIAHYVGINFPLLIVLGLQSIKSKSITNWYSAKDCLLVSLRAKLQEKDNMIACFVELTLFLS
jgi:hypothetical protein